MGKTHSLYFEFYQCGVTIADRFRMSIFEVMQQDTAEAIDYINFMIEKSDDEQEQEHKADEPKIDFWDGI